MHVHGHGWRSVTGMELLGRRKRCMPRRGMLRGIIWRRFGVGVTGAERERHGKGDQPWRTLMGTVEGSRSYPILNI